MARTQATTRASASNGARPHPDRFVIAMERASSRGKSVRAAVLKKSGIIAAATPRDRRSIEKPAKSGGTVRKGPAPSKGGRSRNP